MSYMQQKYPGQHIAPLAEGLHSIGGKVYPSALRAAKFIRELERARPRDDRHDRFVAGLQDRVVDAVLDGESFDYEAAYLAGVPAPVETSRVYRDHHRVVRAVQTEVCFKFVGSLTAELARLHVAATDAVAEHVVLAGALRDTDPMDWPPEVSDARKATENLRRVLAVTKAAVLANGGAHGGSSVHVGRHTKFLGIGPGLAGAGGQRVLAVLEAVAAGPCWAADEVIPERLEIERTGEPTDGWADATVLVEALPA